MAESTTQEVEEPEGAENTEPEGGAEPDGEPEKGTEGEVADLPDWAQRIIGDLRSENASRRKAAEDLKATLKDAKTADEFNTAIGEVRSQLDAAEHELARRDVLREYNIDGDLADFVDGKDRDAMVAAAKKLAAYTKGTPGKQFKRGGGGMSGAATDKNALPDDPAELAKLIPR